MVTSQDQSEVSKRAPETAKPTTGSSLHSRFFSKRSKTDLGSDSLSAYKAGRGNRLSPSKYPAPKVPLFNKPVPQKRSDSLLVSEDKPISLAQVTHFPKHEPSIEQPVLSDSKSKPDVKEKPQFSTFKSQQPVRKPEEPVVQSSFVKPVSAVQRRTEPFSQLHRMSKAVSESDLLHSVHLEGQEEDLENKRDFRVVEHVTSVEPVSITVNSDTSSSPAEDDGDLNTENGKQSDGSIQHSQDETLPDGSVNKKLVIDTSKTFPGEEEQDQSEMSVSKTSYVPPPMSFTGVPMSQPLEITTEPLTEEKMSEGADKSCSTSFDSMEDNSTFPLTEGELSPLDMSNDSVELRTKSPSMSTTSRSPPSPAPMGLSPVKEVRAIIIIISTCLTTCALSKLLSHTFKFRFCHADCA